MTTKRRPVIAGNWKMHKVRDEATQFTQTLDTRIKNQNVNELPDIILCPPFTALPFVRQAVQELNSPILIGAQTMDSHDSGAYTGEVSPLMLTDLQIDMVLIGHSERRQYYNETDSSVNAKIHAALKHHMTPIVCVGETLDQREGGITDAVVSQQVKKALDHVNPEDYSRLIFAYEPIWAIGTGKVCEPPEADRVCGIIRAELNEKGHGESVRILYGGSVKPDNIAELLAQPQIDGALVGGASLDPDSFYKLVQAAIPVQV